MLDFLASVGRVFLSFLSHAGRLAIFRAMRIPASIACMSYSLRRKLKRISGGASGSGLFSRTVPRPSGRR